MVAKMGHLYRPVNPELTAGKYGRIVLFINAALPQETQMDYRKMPTATLKQIEATAREEITKGEADGTSKRLMNVRYGVLGAVSAVLATR